MEAIGLLVSSKHALARRLMQRHFLSQLSHSR